MPVEVQILFSSVGSGLGNVGQGSYATANACLDTLAVVRRSSGTCSCSTQWPLVGGAGMGAAAFKALAVRQVSVVGMAGISLEQFASCLGGTLPRVCGIAESIQLVHRRNAASLLDDLADSAQARFTELHAEAPVSYTHLTLPTICSV